MLLTRKVPDALGEALDALDLAAAATSQKNRAKALAAVRSARASLASARLPELIATVSQRENRSLARIDILDRKLAEASAALEESS
jgi:hypothetical protein